jgi:hypothetical protein
VPSDSTYEQLWRRLRVHAPELPVPLAQEFINNAYSRILARRAWTGMRKETEIYVPQQYSTGTITVANGSPTVVGSGTTFTSAMVGRQLMLTTIGSPMYTIIAVPDALTLTLDRNYTGDNASVQTYSITYILAVMPSDFAYFEDVRDPFNNWKLRVNFPQEILDAWDAKRTVSGTPWVLAPSTFSPVTATLGQMRYEFWPKPVVTAATRTYLVRYISKQALLSDAADKPIFPLRGDVIREGALAELALWPGTSTFRNPYHDLSLHRMHEDRFIKYLVQNEREEDEMNETSIRYEDWTGIPYAPIDAKFWQSHASFAPWSAF